MNQLFPWAIFMLTGNIAGSLLGYGGGLVVFETNIIEITDTDFAGNIAFLGGAMALLNNTNIIFNGLLRFSVNKAVVGAGTPSNDFRINYHDDVIILYHSHKQVFH